MARTRGPDAPPLARRGRGDLLRDLLLRVRDALLPRPWAGRAGDRTPAPAERALCAFWRDQELALLRPALILTVGGLALRSLLGLASLTDAIGSAYQRGDATVVPLPHPSGASGWLNDAANRARLDRALALARSELRTLC